MYRQHKDLSNILITVIFFRFGINTEYIDLYVYY